MRFRSLLSLGMFATFFAGNASATTITFASTSLGGGGWRHDYTLTNDSLGSTLEEFTIFFDLGVYQDLAVAASPAGWDPLVIQPDGGLPDDGYFDALALVGGIPPAGSVAGFGVTFTYLGAGTPGPQRFDVVDPVTFQVLSSGLTSIVPGPGTALLLATGLLALGARARRHSSRGRLE